MQPEHTKAEVRRAPRIAGIDIARGLAIYLMFQSHTVKGLLFFKDMPDFGVVPMHTITKFSSSLFLLVFGVTLGVIFAPRTLDEERWPATRNHLWLRALLVFFWYKVLTVVQTFQTRPRDVIVDMLLYKKFPDFVEILDFYAFVMLLIPLLLPLWRRLPVWVGPLFAAALAGLGQVLAANWDFLGSDFLRAILVEDKKLFCFGLLTRGPLALFGLFIGDLLGRAEEFDRRRLQVAGGCVVVGLALLGLFYGLYHADVYKVLEDIARNRGKHPPQLFFMSFSVGGSMVLLGLCLLVGSRGPLLLKPLEVLGRESLATFVWHIIAIFVGLRWLLELKRLPGNPMVTYDQALMWTGAVTVTALGVAWLNTARKRWQKERRDDDELSALGAFPDTIPGELLDRQGLAAPLPALLREEPEPPIARAPRRARQRQPPVQHVPTIAAERPVSAAAEDHRRQRARAPTRERARARPQQREPQQREGKSAEELEHEQLIKDLLD